MLLVPLRRDEAAGLTWTEVDLQLQAHPHLSEPRENTRSPRITLVASRRWRCSRRASRQRKAISFSRPARQAIRRIPDLLKRIRARIGDGETAKAERFVLHDIRRAFVSHLAERGYDVDLLDQCLGHSRKGVFGVYQRASRMAERARALEAWAGLVAGEVEQTGKVIPIRASGAA